MRRLGLFTGATLIAIGMGAGVLTATQNTSGQEPPFRGGRMGPATGPGGPGRMGPMGPLMPLLARLGLSDAQKDQVKAIMQSHADEFKALGTRAATAHGALETAETTDPVDEGTIRQTSAEVAAVDADMAVARAHVRAEVFQVLTADQKTQAKQLMAKRAGRGRGV
ncbi:MAG TPA: Spy/CpxP family protein refolding chaperone [Vicinamibacterales bacterium]|jgi:Spy/CpxP family protein refolding chaperone|nr:Spy/CpxP family protein refolding chaperone [Vicinamibacterales bacterium]